MNLAAVIPFPAFDAEWAPVGDRVRRLREARGFSQEHLVTRMGLSRQVLVLAERGRGRLTSG